MALSTDDDDEAFYERLLDDPPARLINEAELAAKSIDFEFGRSSQRECRMWEGFLDASSRLFREIVKGGPWTRNLIFPALYNFRHAVELALKWHIRYAGGQVPKHAGHNLSILIENFRATAHGLDDDVTYICEYQLGMIAELADLDPRGVSFRYATEIDGTSIALPEGKLDAAPCIRD